MSRRHTIVLSAIAVAILLLLPLGLLAGGVDLSPNDVWNALLSQGDDNNGGNIARFIVVESRLPAVLTALLAGAALSIAGLLMQTCFNNPLAGPSIMGISSGASLGVAIVGLWGRVAVVGGAFAGAAAILAILLIFSSSVRSTDVLLIVGILIGYLATSAISLLNFFSTERAVHSYVLWGLGTFSGVSIDILPLFAVLVLALICTSLLYSKSLNAMLLGTQYAESVGVSTGRARTGILLLSGALTAVVTAWCGPIGFIGLVVPHIARMVLGSSNHRVLLPACALCGALLGIICQIISVWPSLSKGAVIPVNAITPVIGVPVIIYVLLNRRRLLYFN